MPDRLFLHDCCALFCPQNLTFSSSVYYCSGRTLYDKLAGSLHRTASKLEVQAALWTIKQFFAWHRFKSIGTKLSSQIKYYCGLFKSSNALSLTLLAKLLRLAYTAQYYIII
jgi:hypothetical protein